MPIYLCEALSVVHAGNGADHLRHNLHACKKCTSTGVSVSSSMCGAWHLLNLSLLAAGPECCSGCNTGDVSVHRSSMGPPAQPNTCEGHKQPKLTIMFLRCVRTGAGFSPSFASFLALRSFLIRAIGFLQTKTGEALKTWLSVQYSELLHAMNIKVPYWGHAACLQGLLKMTAAAHFRACPVPP